MKSALSPLEGNGHFYPKENQWVRLKSSKSCQKSELETAVAFPSGLVMFSPREKGSAHPIRQSNTTPASNRCFIQMRIEFLLVSMVSTDLWRGDVCAVAAS